VRPFAYTAPGSVDAVVDALRDARPGTKILAGGTTLYDLMKLGVETPPAVIDVHRLPELTGISVTDTELVFGAGLARVILLSRQRHACSGQRANSMYRLRPTRLCTRAKSRTGKRTGSIACSARPRTTIVCTRRQTRVSIGHLGWSTTILRVGRLPQAPTD